MERHRPSRPQLAPPQAPAGGVWTSTVDNTSLHAAVPPHGPRGPGAASQSHGARQARNDGREMPEGCRTWPMVPLYQDTLGSGLRTATALVPVPDLRGPDRHRRRQHGGARKPPAPELKLEGFAGTERRGAWRYDQVGAFISWEFAGQGRIGNGPGWVKTDSAAAR